MGTNLHQFCKMLTNYLSDEQNKRSPTFFICHPTAFDSWKYLLTFLCFDFITKKKSKSDKNMCFEVHVWLNAFVKFFEILRWKGY